MIKLSRSQMHESPVFHFFKGRKKLSSPGVYVYADSLSLYGSENLAPNLIEYDDETELMKFTSSQEFLKIYSGIEVSSKKRSTFIFTEIKKLTDYDLEIEFYGDSLAPSCVRAANDTFGPILALKFEIKEVRDAPNLFNSAFFKDKHYAKLNIANELIDRGSSALSPKYQTMFSPERYVDSQIPIFMLGSLLYGSADPKP